MTTEIRNGDKPEETSFVGTFGGSQPCARSDAARDA